MELDSLRDEYTYSGLDRESVESDPYNQFEKWMNEALHAGIKYPTAMAVSTISTDGCPRSRIVLLKYYDKTGFVFFTNYESEKGKSLEVNNAAGLHFFWPELERQVIIAGYCEKTDRSLSEKYFSSRPVDSQISAWASPQSREVPSRDYLENRFSEFQKKFENHNIPTPEFWGGYRVVPIKIEFWQGRINRLHDRILYEKRDNAWVIKILAS
jgi:pyridoxamine 5'-phosphate oxidase